MTEGDKVAVIYYLHVSTVALGITFLGIWTILGAKVTLSEAEAVAALPIPLEATHVKTPASV